MDEICHIEDGLNIEGASSNGRYEFPSGPNRAAAVFQQLPALLKVLTVLLFTGFLLSSELAGSGPESEVLPSDPGLTRGTPPTSHPGLTQARLKGFVNTRLTSSLLLCPSNMEYRIAGMLVPIFWQSGFTPNGIVALNCVIRALLLWRYSKYSYNAVVVLLGVIQVLDAADGELARRHGMTSPFGGMLDHLTDNAFTALFAIYTLYLVAGNKGVQSRGVILMTSVFVFIAFLGFNYENAIDHSILYKDCNVFQILGMYQALYMLYIQWILTAVACHLTDWLPHRHVA